MFVSRSTLTAAALAAAAGAFLPCAQASTSDSIDSTAGMIAQAITQFDSAGLIPTPINSQWVQPVAGLTVHHGDHLSVLGNLEDLNLLQERPLYTLNISSASAETSFLFAQGQQFTVMYIDASYAGYTGGSNVTRHQLANNFTVDPITGDLVNGNPVTRYAAPYPDANDGPHRYMQLVWQQPANFVTPDYPPSNSGVESWDLNAYVQAAGLQRIVAMSYYQVTRGTAAAPSATSAPAQAAIASASASVAAGLSSVSLERGQKLAECQC